MPSTRKLPTARGAVDPSEGAIVQIQADVANLLLVLSMGRQFGLVDDLGSINIQACETCLASANALGIRPRTLGPVSA